MAAQHVLTRPDCSDYQGTPGIILPEMLSPEELGIRLSFCGRMM